MHLTITNLATQVTSNELRKLFEPFGIVEAVEIATDVFTDRSRGYGFVEMPSDEQAQAAITALNNTDVAGSAIVVKEGVPVAAPRGSYKVGDGSVITYRTKTKRGRR